MLVSVLSRLKKAAIQNLFPILFPVMLLTTFGIEKIPADAKGFIDLGIGGMWEGGDCSFGDNALKFEVPRSTNRFVCTLTGGVLLTQNHWLMGPYIDASYTPASGQPSQLVGKFENQSLLSKVTSPSFRWNVGIEVNYLADRIMPFIRVGWAREKLTFSYQSLDDTAENQLHANGIVIGGGLNYAVTPSIFLGPSFNIKFFQQQKLSLADKKIAVHPNDLSFLINIRYLTDFKRHSA